MGGDDIRCAHKEKPLHERSATINVRGEREDLDQLSLSLPNVFSCLARTFSYLLRY